MSFIWLAGMVSTAAGIGIGGIIAWFFKKFQKSIDTIYALCSGLLIGLISLEIAPEAVKTGDWIIFLLGFLTGALLFELLNLISKAIPLYTNIPEKDLFIHTSMLLTLSISVHNFPLGIILGSNHSSSIHASLLQTIMLHNIPEGIVLFTPLFMAGFGFYTWVFFSILVALPVGLGSFIGMLMGIGNPFLWAFIISITVGILVMVTVKEILSESIKHSSVISSLILSTLAFSFVFLYFAWV